MINKILKDRSWSLHFSFLNRKCYISGDTIKFIWAYRGRKKIFNPMLSKYDLNDDIWITQREYLKLLSKGQI